MTTPAEGYTGTGLATPASLFHLYTFLNNVSGTGSIQSAALTVTGLPPSTNVYCRIEDNLALNNNPYGWTGGCVAPYGTAGGLVAILTDAAGTLTIDFTAPLNANPVLVGGRVGIRLYGAFPNEENLAVLNPVATLQYSANTVLAAGDPVLTAPAFTIPLYNTNGNYNSISVGTASAAGNTATVPVTFNYPGMGAITGVSYAVSLATAPGAGTTYACTATLNGVAVPCNWNGAALTFTGSGNLDRGDVLVVNLSYTDPTGLSNNSINFAVNSTALNSFPIVGAGGRGISGVMPFAFGAGGAASVPATGALALGGMAALIALTPVLAARRRRRNP